MSATTGRDIGSAFLHDALARYVAIDSRNPAFTDGATDEAALARAVRHDLEEAGLSAETVSAGPGRDSVVARLPGTGGGASLMLYAHLDTVGVEGMERPFEPEVRDGRLYGRGAYDMKAGLASCVAVARALAAAARFAGGRLAGDVVVVAAADEETESAGMQAVLRETRTDAAIVTEPTDLEICLAHKGFVWLRVTTHGRAAHGSRFDEGVDANMRMGRFLALLEGLERELVERRPAHPLTGPPSLHAATLRGGTGPSTYADRCEVRVERRTVPGERVEDVEGELAAILDHLAVADPTFRASCETLLHREPFEARADSPIVASLERAWTSVVGTAPRRSGATYWMDSALIAAAGIDTVVFGPGGAGAHAVEEWADLDTLDRHAEIMLAATRSFCAQPPPNRSP
ncbi:MAG TPA: M20/M25/M40 family metallo-hydrolase [Longimicrobiales bacterium]|nr:M20/M25/M40 family metallo-hydrolase [Longimicrobiales bacterium]